MIHFCCPSNEQQIMRHCFPPSAHGMRTNESLSLTNVGDANGWGNGCELTGNKGLGNFSSPMVTMPRDGRQPV